MRKLFFLLFIAFFCLNNVYAQKQKIEYHTTKRKAINYFEDALDFMHHRKDDLAMAAANEAAIVDPDFLEAYFLMYSLSEYDRDYDKMEENLREVLRIDAEYSIDLFVIAGKLAYRRGDYHQAKEDLLNYEDYLEPSDEPHIHYAELLARTDFALDAIENPVDFEPINLGENVNTQYDDYWPSLTADEECLVTTIQIPRTHASRYGGSGNYHEDLFESLKDESGEWSSRANMGSTLNTPQNEGAQCISSDGNMCVFTACNRSTGYGSCDLYISRRNGDRWSKPKNLGNTINSVNWESNPSLSANGKYLYYSSSDPNGDGGMDIWRVEMSGERVVSYPQHLKGGVNTKNDDCSPFIHPDGKTLYFASNGHLGMGDYDLFVSRLMPDGKWSEAENIGYPINTNKEERSLIVNTRGSLAMYASEREEGFGGLDIYEFELPKEVQPNVVTYVKGRVYDVETNNSLAAICKLYELESGENVAIQASDEVDGKYLVCLPKGFDYAFNVEKEGYLFYSENFSLKDIESDDDTYILDIPLQPIKEGQSVVLKNIFFDFNQYSLKSESYVELKRLVQFMQRNSHISIEIGGHTDNVGTVAYNQKLSTDRAKSVYDYLINQGISIDRLSYKGYGFDVPIADNSTEVGRAKNRRTEFKIVKLSVD